MNVSDLPELATVDEVAAALRLDRGTLYDQIRAGGLPVVRLGPSGRVIRVPRQAIEQLIAGALNGGGASP